MLVYFLYLIIVYFPKMDCKKCSAPGVVILRRNDRYCESCFITNTNHKFRASLGKNKILSKNEKVLICISGGVGSTVLLNLIINGMDMENHKKLRITPFCLHIIETTNDAASQAKSILEYCTTYKIDIYFIHIAQYVDDTLELTAPNCIPSVTPTSVEKYKALIQNLSPTGKNDLILKIKRNLYIQCADKLCCKFVFTAETTTTLSINLLSNITLGRGCQVEHDVGFCDNRSSVKILRPMKDITQEELLVYSKIKNIEPVNNDKDCSHSLQSVIALFVKDLQENFPATISTVCKTADKIGACNEPRKIQCSVCQSILDIENSGLTSLEAIKFSRAVSQIKREDYENPIHLEDLQFEENNKLSFTQMNENLCYSCNRNFVLLT